MHTGGFRPGQPLTPKNSPVTRISSPSLISKKEKKTVTFSIGNISQEMYDRLKEEIVLFAKQKLNTEYADLSRDVSDCFELRYSPEDLSDLSTLPSIQEFSKDAIKDIVFGNNGRNGLLSNTYEFLNKSISEKINIDLEKQNLSKDDIRRIQKSILEDIRDELQQLRREDELRYREKAEELLPDILQLCERIKLS